MKRKDRGGFTLIELLVVVAIISLLAAIAIPNIAGRLKKARMTKAEADIKNLETAIEMFRTDTGYLPFYSLFPYFPPDRPFPNQTVASFYQTFVLYSTPMLEAILKVTQMYAEEGLFRGGVRDTVQRNYMPKGIALDPWKKRYVYVERFPGGTFTRDLVTYLPQVAPEITGTLVPGVYRSIDLDYYIYSRGQDQAVYDPYRLYEQYGVAGYSDPDVYDDVSNWDVDRLYQKAYQ